MEKIREKMLCALITILLCGTVFSALSQPAMPEKAEKGTPQVTVTIKRIEAVDAMDLLDEADWYYWVGFALSTSSSISWSRYPSSGANSNSNVWEPNSVHTYTTPSNPGSVYLYIMLCDDDNEVGLNLPDDLADISDDAGGGYDDVAIDITPPGGLSYYFGTYVGIYDMITNTLSGNYTEFVNNMYKTSGNFDGSTSIDQNDANLYFTITDNYDKPTATISASTYTAHINENIVFSGTNSNASQASTIVSYSWNFGDGHTGSGSQVTHAYSATGQYTVSLTVTDDWGQTSTATTVINITNAPPVANFTYTPAQPTILDTIQFTDQSTDADGFITAWAWNFGDGNTSTQQNPTHKYSAKGTYTVSLMVTDNNGATNTTVRTITVVNAPPVANFTYTPAQPTILDTIQFNDASTDPDGSITSWLWDFGDNYTSTEKNPSHKYNTPGTYTVKLTVTDNDGGSATKSIQINVREATNVGSITGTVEDSNGTKLEGVVITVTSGGTTVGTAVTDTAGRYTVSGLTPSKYDIKAHKDGYEDSIQYSISVSAGNTTTVNFVLSKIGTTGSIAGTVKDASGNPIANAEICVYKEGTSILVKKAISGTDGSYTISGLSPGKYDVVFSATGYENRTIASQEVKSGDTTTVNAVLTKIGGEGTQGAGMLLWLLPLLIIIIVVVIVVVYLLKKKSSPGQPQQPPQYQQPPQP